MKYTVLYDNPDESLITRLFKIRAIEDTTDSFLYPSFSKYRQSPALLSNIDTAIARIMDAINRQEKIMVFGDYDVDGIVSTYIMYSFFKEFLRYPHISLRLPHKLHDGYGIKPHHIDEILTTGSTLIITVDNGISAHKETAYARSLGIDMIITDHHQAGPELPDAVAVVNPHISAGMSFKHLCGAAVAFKVCMALAEHLIPDRNHKKTLFTRFLPFVSIATIADCMPLINENRLLVKKGLEIMNTQRSQLAPSLQMMLKHLNIDMIDTFHVGFMIAPRLNATGRMDSAVEGLKSLLFTNPTHVHTQLLFMDELNTRRKQTQDDILKHVLQSINLNSPILIAGDESYHEGIIGIVAGRITEKHNKPSLVLGVDTTKGIATGSLRGPAYFNIVDMLHTASDLLERYGGHAQAGGLTVRVENMEALYERLEAYCTASIRPEDMHKTISVDTKVHDEDLSDDSIHALSEFGPFGEGNPEPQLLFEDVDVLDAEQVGKNDTKHLKIYAKKGAMSFTIMRRRKGDIYDSLQPRISLIGKVRKDTFKGGIFVEATALLDIDEEEIPE